MKIAIGNSYRDDFFEGFVMKQKIVIFHFCLVT